MIVAMQRLTLLCAAREQSIALKALRALECVHVQIEVRDSESIRHAKAEVLAVDKALRVLDAARKGSNFVFKPDASSPLAAMSFAELLAQEDAALAEPTLETVNTTAELITRLNEEAFAAEMALKRYAPFGEIDPEQIHALGEKGIPVVLFRAMTLPVAEGCFSFGKEGGFTYGAWISAEPLPEGCEVIPTPTASSATWRATISQAAESTARLMARMNACAKELQHRLKAQRLKSLAQQTAAEVASNVRDEGDVALLQGYIPERDVAKLTERANAEGWGFVLETPEEGDPNVPVLLEPPHGFRAVNAIFQGLGILPGYFEGDVSVAFYIFFSIFFAMLIGDAGYGAVMLTAVLAAGWKLRKQAAAKPVILIFTVFCLATILWGVLSGTYFGIAKDALPECLKALPTVAWLGQDANIIFLCFLLGILHISLARVWNAILLAPSIRALGEIGWLGVSWSMFLIVCGIVVSWFTQPDWAWWLLGGSTGLILVPMLCDIRKEGINIGMLPLNIISSMGDIISYVRLFAVGLASVKVAENFNAMAVGLDIHPVVNVLACCAILLLGHGLNLAMGALSILVHAVRLNTLEFSNAKGVTWSGIAYKPFKRFNGAEPTAEA